MATVVALSFHPAFTPPKSGGEERLYYVYKNLSSQHNIVLISFTFQNETNSIQVEYHTPSFKEIRIPKTNISSTLHHIISRYTSIKECSAIVTSIESQFNKNYKNIVEKELTQADVVIFVSPFLNTLPEHLLHKKTIIYEAYNNEYELMKSSFSHSILGKFLLYYVRHLERELSKHSDLIFTVSQEDKESLCRTYGISEAKLAPSPNGIPVTYYDPVLHNRKRNPHQHTCVFIGSYHPPNIEAIEHIVNFACKVPDITFLVVGGASQYYINHREMVEPCVFCSTDSFSHQSNVHLSNGFYALEHWGDTPVIWTQPQWAVTINEGVEEVSVTLYSPSEQKIKVAGGITERTLYNLILGWNTISIKSFGLQRSTLRFMCEKVLTDSGRRTLGVAIKELQYYKDSDWNQMSIADSTGQTFRFRHAQNVYLLGQVSEEEKFAIYKTADIALNPMTSGSGTNIKVLGYLASGIPLITTQKGARGLALENNKNAIICNISEFPEKIRDVLKDSNLATSLANNGRQLVEEIYDWSNITSDMTEKINELLQDG